MLGCLLVGCLDPAQSTPPGDALPPPGDTADTFANCYVPATDTYDTAAYEFVEHCGWPATPAGGVTIAHPGSLGDIAAESMRCLTIGNDITGTAVIVAVGLDTGATAVVARLPRIELRYTNALTLRGDTLTWLFQQGAGSALATYNLRAGRLQIGRATYRPSDLAEVGGTWFAWTHDELRPLLVYPSRVALERNRPSDRVRMPLSAEVIGASETELFGAWHSGRYVHVFDPLTLDWVEDVRLQQYDTWVNGIDGVGDDLIVMDDGRGTYWRLGIRIGTFDRTTGDNVSNVFLPRDFGVPELVSTALWGLACAR